MWRTGWTHRSWGMSAARAAAAAHWICVTIPKEVRAVCRLVAVIANAVEVQFIDPAHYAASLTAGSISKVQGVLASAGAPALSVDNPRYEELRLEFKVRFRRGDFNFYRDALQQALLRQLSPWAFDPLSDISFGGQIYKSALIDFVEHLP